ncbi:MAG: cytochrome P450 [Dehalococcoidia bacterium]
MTLAQVPHPQDINLGDPLLFERAEAHDALRILRREAPVHWNPGTEEVNGFWSLVKYADILYVSRNPELFISSKGIAGSGLRHPERAADYEGPDSVSIITMDPPRHVKLRRLVNKGFTPRAVNAMESQIRRITNEILDGIADKSSCDFVLDVSSQLPLAVICGMLGLQREVWPLMFELTNSVLGSGDPEYQKMASDAEPGSDEAARQTSTAGWMRMGGFFKEVLDKRRLEPTGDLISILIEAEVDGEKLTENDILEFCFLLLLAGNETTRNAISGGLQVLCEHPQERARLQADMSLIDSAVEEILRWTSPLHHMTREVTADVEIRGQKIRAGEKVLMWYPSANRDEDVFEDPYRFDITREPNEHLAFGIGEHFCLGAGFARKEMKVMFEELFRRFPDIQIEGPAERLRSNFINGIKHIRVSYTPER